MIVFRKMMPADIDAGLSLCRAATWNQLARDWEIFLQLSADGCRIAVKEDRVVGTVTTIRYQHSFSWIGMVLVDPANQRQGIGMQLLKEALVILQKEETVKLDATPAGREVYLKIGFVDEYGLSRMSTVARDGITAGSLARPVQRNDLPAIIAFDKLIFGADRQSLLEWMWEGAPRYAFMIEDELGVQGYCLGRNGNHYAHIGPVVANKLEIAKELLSSALRNCVGEPVIIDAMEFEQEWIGWLQATGFTRLRQLTRMYRGSNAYPGIPEKQFLILGPEFG